MKSKYRTSRLWDCGSPLAPGGIRWQVWLCVTVKILFTKTVFSTTVWQVVIVLHFALIYGIWKVALQWKFPGLDIPFDDAPSPAEKTNVQKLFTSSEMNQKWDEQKCNEPACSQWWQFLSQGMIRAEMWWRQTSSISRASSSSYNDFL